MTINGFYPISVAGALVLTWLYSFDPLIAAMLFAVMWVNVAIHELGHVAAVFCTGGRVTGLKIRPWHGVTRVLQSDRLAFAAISLAGPAAGLVAGASALILVDGLTAGSAPTASGIALQAMLWTGLCDNIFNLLPLGLLDGRQCVKALRQWGTVRSLSVRRRWIRALQEAGAPIPETTTAGAVHDLARHGQRRPAVPRAWPAGRGRIAPAA